MELNGCIPTYAYHAKLNDEQLAWKYVFECLPSSFGIDDSLRLRLQAHGPALAVASSARASFLPRPTSTTQCQVSRLLLLLLLLQIYLCEIALGSPRAAVGAGQVTWSRGTSCISPPL